MDGDEIADFDHELPQEPGRKERRSHGAQELMGLMGGLGRPGR